MRVFEKNKISPKGLILSREDFVLFSDLEHPTLQEDKMSAVVATAEKHLNAPITTIPLWRYRQYFEQGSVEIYSRGYMERLDKLVYLGVAEAYEGKGRFTARLADWIWAILEMSSWVLPEHTWHFPHHSTTKVPPVAGDKYMHGLELGAIYLGATLALVYHYNKAALDAISPIIGKRIRRELHERIVKPYLCCSFTWEGDMGNKVNNWCPWNISNILIVTALNEDKMYNRERVVEKALRHLDNFISWYKEDGGCDEGPTYWGAAAGSLFDCLEIIEDMSGGRINVYSNDLIRNIGEYIYKVNINANKVVNFADCGPTVTPPASLLIRYGEKCSSPFLVSFGKKIAALGDFGVGYWQMYRGIKALFTPDVEAENCPMPLATYLPDLKVVTMRQSEDSAKGVFLGMKGGSNGEMHNHNDVGNFIVYKDGNPVIIDTGVGTYTKQTFSNRRYELWFMQSGYHNLPSFGGVDQKEGGAFRSSDEEYSEEGRSFRCQLKNAYPAAAGVTDFVRCAKLSEGRVTVSDSITLAEEKEIVFHYMCATRPEIKEAGVIALAEGMTMRYNPELACEIEEFEPTGMNAKASWGTDMLYRIVMKAFTDRIEHTVVIE